MNKNWNDRADKDLFFTILNVKNIGVISGSEWTTIGNTMRSMGYGFTNEGCRNYPGGQIESPLRPIFTNGHLFVGQSLTVYIAISQHFQGLRRAQAKSETTPNPTLPVDGTRKADPTQNPITRRPGPGRGRPKKSASSLDGSQPGAEPASAGPPGPGNAVAAGVPTIPGASPVEIHPQYSDGAIAPVRPVMPGLQIDQKLSQPPPTDLVLPPTAEQTPLSDELAVDPSLEDSDEQVAKRPRLDDSQSASLDTDEAMLSALAAHNSGTSVDNFGADRSIYMAVVILFLAVVFFGFKVLSVLGSVNLGFGVSASLMDERAISFLGLVVYERIDMFEVAASVLPYPPPQQQKHQTDSVAGPRHYPNPSNTSTLFPTTSRTASHPARPQQGTLKTIFTIDPVYFQTHRRLKEQSIITMCAAKESKWCEAAHSALCGALTNALVEAGSSPAKHKDSILEFMESKGQVFTWEGIRYVVKIWPSGLSVYFLVHHQNIFPVQHLPTTIFSTRSPFEYNLIDHRSKLSSQSSKMPKWTPETERDLLLALYTAVQPHLDKEVQTAIITKMKERGHDDVNWDLLSGPSPPLLPSILSLKRCLPNFRGLRSDKCSSKAFPSILPQFDTQRAAKPSPSISSTHKRNTSFLGPNRNPPHFFSTFHRPANMPKWEEIRDDLFEAIMAVQPALGKEQQEQVVVFMQSRGHNMVWNAISDFNAISKATNSPSSFVIQDRHQNNLEIMSSGSKQHVWTAEAYKDVLMALNNHFCPNAADCRAIIVVKMSGGRVLQKWTAEVHEAILIEAVDHVPNSDWKAIVERLQEKGFTFTLSALLSRRLPSFLSLSFTVLISQASAIALHSSRHQFCTQSPHFNMAPTNWDHDAHLALLQAVMAKAPPTQSEWDQILEEVGRKGYVYTSGAAMQHLQKLRRKEGGAASAVNSGNDEAATPNKGGRKRGPTAGVKKDKTPKHKSAKIAKNEDDSEDDLNYSSASKKIKIEEARDLIDDDDGAGGSDLPPLNGSGDV
ncbi:hypothetical protein V8F33_013570 [Rhypophila sp. PSN 637]